MTRTLRRALTPVYPPTVKPLPDRRGLYRVSHLPFDESNPFYLWAKWDGVDWRMPSSFKQYAQTQVRIAAFQDLYWQGVYDDATTPKETDHANPNLQTCRVPDSAAAVAAVSDSLRIAP